MSLYTIDTLPADSQAAIREFVDRYIAGVAAGPVSSWSTELGDMIETDKPMLSFPIAALGLKYQEHKGQNRAKTASEEMVDVKTVEFDEGVEESLMHLTTNVYSARKWASAPARLLLEEAQHRNRNIATLLEAGDSTTCFDGQNFFATAHPCNIGDSSKGTFSNYQTNTKSVVSLSNIETECGLFMENAKDEQGDKIDSKPDTIIVPTAKYMALSNLLGQALVPNVAGTATMNNPFYGGVFNVVHAPQLSDADDWYLADSKRIKSAAIPPWVIVKQSVPESLSLRVYDESTDFFRDSGKLKISSHIWYGFGLVFPHGIRLIKGA